MNANEYQKLAMQKEASQWEIHKRAMDLGIIGTRVENGLRGLVDEVGEIASCVKKWKEYGQPLDRYNLLEEIGDCLWRLSQIASAVDVTLEQAMQANLRKLKVRYVEALTNEEAANRDLEAEARALRAQDDGVFYQEGDDEWSSGEPQ